jgi:hypothetical protein
MSGTKATTARLAIRELRTNDDGPNRRSGVSLSNQRVLALKMASHRLTLSNADSRWERSDPGRVEY